MKDNIREPEPLEDEFTSSEDELEPSIDAEQQQSFYRNLAADFPEEGLNKLANYLLEAVEEDNEARRDWMDAVEKALQYLGLSLEDLSNPSLKGFNRTFDTTAATALFRFYATTRAEILPANGPAGFKINGITTDFLEATGAKVANYINYYLTVKDKAYYSDFERCLLYLGFYGSAFKKIYYDSILGRPVSRFILPQDFIVDSDCSSILESNRLTHILHLSKREILTNQQNGRYLDVELPYLKSLEIDESDEIGNNSDKRQTQINLEAYSKRSLFPIYEVHTYLNLEDFYNSSGTTDQSEDIPLPYIVTIDKISKKILSIRNNWREEDQTKQRINYFIQYNYLPGFNIYGYGLAHLLGCNAITLTTILRQLIDAGAYKNLPGGFRVKGFKQQQNDIIVAPGHFPEVDTGGIPLKEAFMPLPYSEPSVVLKDLMLHVMTQCKELGSTTELGMLDSREDIPTGTAFAFLEVQNRLQSAVLKSIHNSLSDELQLIAQVFRETLQLEEFFTSNQVQQVSAADFLPEIEIIPVTDPSVNSLAQRVMRATSILQLAQQAPELHNMRAVFENVYKAHGLDQQEIEKILLPVPTPEEMMNNQQQTVDPNSLLMADIQQKEMETAARERIANQKAETDIFKAQLDFEKQKAKIESAEDIAKLKAETELIKQGVIDEARQ